jgi:hypothetical protein
VKEENAVKRANKAKVSKVRKGKKAKRVRADYLGGTAVTGAMQVPVRKANEENEDPPVQLAPLENVGPRANPEPPVNEDSLENEDPKEHPENSKS